MATSRRNKTATILVALIVLTVTIPACGGSGTGPAGPPDPEGSGYKGLQVLYGDPHIHTILSDGDESPDFALRYARDVADLDWACITDHSEHFQDAARAGLNYYRTLPAKYDEPGRFCVLFGYEWTNLYYGHRNVYSLDNMVPLFPSNMDEYFDVNDWWIALEPYDVITVSHHPMIDTPYVWWDYTNPGVDVAVEFYSKWGLSLREGNPRPINVRSEANGIFPAMGGGERRYGLIAGSDTHMSRPGTYLEESRQGHALQYVQPGITGVWAVDFTREAIFDSMRNRHTYGVTGTIVDLKFTVNGFIMGSETTALNPPTIWIEASSDEVITEVAISSISKIGIVGLAIYTPNSLDFETTFVDQTFADDLAYTVRVTLANTDMAVASPVWVDYEAPGPVI